MTFNDVVFGAFMIFIVVVALGGGSGPPNDHG